MKLFRVVFTLSNEAKMSIRVGEVACEWDDEVTDAVVKKYGHLGEIRDVAWEVACEDVSIHSLVQYMDKEKNVVTPLGEEVSSLTELMYNFNRMDINAKDLKETLLPMDKEAIVEALVTYLTGKRRMLDNIRKKFPMSYFTEGTIGGKKDA